MVSEDEKRKEWWEQSWLPEPPKQDQGLLLVRIESNHGPDAYGVSDNRLVFPSRETWDEIVEEVNAFYDLVGSAGIDYHNRTKALGIQGVNWEKHLQEQPQRLIELKEMPYSKYLQTLEWKATRERILKQANECCQLCYKKSGLHVHHKSYERRGEEWDEDLVVLCDQHHKWIHDIE